MNAAHQSQLAEMLHWVAPELGHVHDLEAVLPAALAVARIVARARRVCPGPEMMLLNPDGTEEPIR